MSFKTPPINVKIDISFSSIPTNKQAKKKANRKGFKTPIGRAKPIF